MRTSEFPPYDYGRQNSGSWAFDASAGPQVNKHGPNGFPQQPPGFYPAPPGAFGGTGWGNAKAQGAFGGYTGPMQASAQPPGGYYNAAGFYGHEAKGFVPQPWYFYPSQSGASDDWKRGLVDEQVLGVPPKFRNIFFVTEEYMRKWDKYHLIEPENRDKFVHMEKNCKISFDQVEKVAELVERMKHMIVNEKKLRQGKQWISLKLASAEDDDRALAEDLWRVKARMQKSQRELQEYMEYRIVKAKLTEEISASPKIDFLRILTGCLNWKALTATKNYMDSVQRKEAEKRKRAYFRLKREAQREIRGIVDVWIRHLNNPETRVHDLVREFEFPRISQSCGCGLGEDGLLYYKGDRPAYLKVQYRKSIGKHFYMYRPLEK